MLIESDWRGNGSDLALHPFWNVTGWKKEHNGIYQSRCFPHPLDFSNGIFPLPVLLYDSALFPSLPFCVVGKEDAVLGLGIVLRMSQAASLLALVCFGGGGVGWGRGALCWAGGSGNARGECEVCSCPLVYISEARTQRLFISIQGPSTFAASAWMTVPWWWVKLEVHTHFFLLCSIFLLNVK